jgi:hypothetical protein
LGRQFYVGQESVVVGSGLAEPAAAMKIADANTGWHYFSKTWTNGGDVAVSSIK